MSLSRQTVPASRSRNDLTVNIFMNKILVNEF